MTGSHALKNIAVVYVALFYTLGVITLGWRPGRRRGGSQGRGAEASILPAYVNGEGKTYVALAPGPAVDSVELPSQKVTLQLNERQEIVALTLEGNTSADRRKQTKEGSDYFVTLEDASRILRLEISWLRRKAREGDLKAVKMHDQWFTTYGWIEEFDSTRQPAGRPAKRGS